MKKKLLVLGSVLALLASPAARADEDMSFGARLGGTWFMNPVGDTTVGSDQNYKGELNVFVGGGAFFDYRVVEDMLSVGIDAGYAQRGFSTKLENSTNATEAYSLSIHTLEATVPVAYLPMGYEGGLSVFAGPKVYIPISSSENKINEDTDAAPADGVVSSFNIGAAVGFKYEIMESGLLLAANYEFFFLDMVGNNDTKTNVGKAADDTFYNQGVQFGLGYDFGRLME